MNNAIGMIIKYNRTKMHISQSELSREICVPSYLSKIENGEITAHPDIYSKLLSRLNISYDNIASKDTASDKIVNLIVMINNLKRKQDTIKYFQELDESYEQSPYIFEYLAMKYFYSEKELPGIKNILLESVSQLDDKSAFFVLIMLYNRKKEDTALLEKAIRIYPCGYGYFIKGISLYKEKLFSEAFRYFQMAETEYLKSGSFAGIIHSKRHQAVMLSFTSDKYRAIAVFEGVKNLLKENMNPAFDGIVLSCDYNINFLKYDLGIEHNLEEICTKLIDSGEFNNSLPFHVMYTLHQNTDTDKAKQYLKDGMEKFTDKNSFDYLQLDIDLFKLENPDYMKLNSYYNKLKAIHKSLEPNGNFGIRYSIEKEIIDYLKTNRKYKEALEMTESLGELEY